ncbi:MAG: hypothetical protein KJ006_04500 [Thermoleophilia bacterium]|nr:hypothetical protein [Thermoleophilia bacterium]GIK77547.1 MAG: hypothetical protein BroJett022_12370 [Actinomycetes bacterium]
MSAVAAIVSDATIVDVEALLDTAVASVVAAVIVTLSASLAIYGFATAAEMRRTDRDLAAIGAGVLAAASSLVFAATIALGIYVMING